MKLALRTTEKYKTQPGLGQKLIQMRVLNICSVKNSFFPRLFSLDHASPQAQHILSCMYTTPTKKWV